MANVGVQRVWKLLVFTETQLSARFLHFVIIFCQKMAVFPCNVREARLSACHLGRRILARFCLCYLWSTLCSATNLLWCAYLWNMLCSVTSFALCFCCGVGLWSTLCSAKYFLYEWHIYGANCVSLRVFCGN